MLQNAEPAAISWLAYVRDPALVLAGVGIFFRLVLVPATLRLVRAELKQELDTVDELRLERPLVKAEIAEHRRALDRLADVPEGIARIEEQLRTLLKDRGRHA